MCFGQFFHQPGNDFPGGVEFLSNLRIGDFQHVGIERIPVTAQIEFKSFVHVLERDVVNCFQQFLVTTTVGPHHKMIPGAVLSHPVFGVFERHRQQNGVGDFFEVFKMMAAQSGWWGLGAVMADAGPKLARSGMTTSGAMGRGPFAFWNAMLAGSVEMTTTMLNAQRAIMAPMWSAAHANSVRLGKSAR